VKKQAILAAMAARFVVWSLAIARDPRAGAYMDAALTPACDDDEATLDLLTKTAGARAAVAHFKKVAVLTGVGRELA
jgi:hypothetical protein